MESVGGHHTAFAEPRSVRRVLDRSMAGIIVVALSSALAFLALTLELVLAVGPHLQRSVDAQSTMSQALAGMLDQETGLRAYVATHDATFLQPDAAGRGQTAQAMNRLPADVVDGSDDVRALAHLSAAQQAWESAWADRARSLRTGSDITAFLAQGKTLFDDYRAAESQAAALVASDMDEGLATSQHLSVALVSVAGLGLLAMVVAWLLARRRIHRLYEEVDERSRTDPLTGLANRHSFAGDIFRAVTLAERHRRPLAVAMIDVDNFKQYNDTFGHQAGDDALREVASLLRQRVRASDTVYRYGGEEIVVLLPETDLDGATVLMERVRVAVEERFAAESPRPITVSIGVSACPIHGDDARTVLEAADSALYRSKESGRNRVTAAGAPVIVVPLAGV